MIIVGSLVAIYTFLDMVTKKWSQVVLVTGGAGYIGSHICKLLAEVWRYSYLL